MIKKLLLFVLLQFFVIGCFADPLGIENDMEYVEGGKFNFGMEPHTPHLVQIILDDFYISKFETTVEQWEQFLRETGISYEWKGKYYDTRIISPYLDSPIGVSWRLALEYANWVSRYYDLEECYRIKNNDEIEWDRKANGYRLLTDAEWEFAAKGGNLSNGYIFSGSNNLDEVAWTGWNSDDSTHPIGTKKANELGLFDMSGNIEEWCWDLMSDYPYNPDLLLVNPEGPSLEEYLKTEKRRWRVMRGGSYGGSDLKLFTSSFRGGGSESGSDTGPGIRLARNAK